MGRVMSIVGVPMIFGPIVGPTLGGILIDDLSWKNLRKLDPCGAPVPPSGEDPDILCVSH